MSSQLASLSTSTVHDKGLCLQLLANVDDDAHRLVVVGRDQPVVNVPVLARDFEAIAAVPVELVHPHRMVEESSLPYAKSEKTLGLLGLQHKGTIRSNKRIK